MAGSIPGSGFAESVAVGTPTVRDRRWDALRRAARARLAPLGAVVVAAAVVVMAAQADMASTVMQRLNPYHPVGIPALHSHIEARCGW